MVTSRYYNFPVPKYWGLGFQRGKMVKKTVISNLISLMVDQLTTNLKMVNLMVSGFILPEIAILWPRLKLGIEDN